MKHMLGLGLGAAALAALGITQAQATLTAGGPAQGGAIVESSAGYLGCLQDAAGNMVGCVTAYRLSDGQVAVHVMGRGYVEEATLPASAMTVDESEVDERVLLSANLPTTGAIEINAQRVNTNNPATGHCTSVSATEAFVMHYELASTEDHDLATARVTGTWGGVAVVGKSGDFECGTGSTVFYGPTSGVWHRAGSI